MADVTIREALQHAADNPQLMTDEIIQVPVHELIARTLFEIANQPDTAQRGSLARANKARKMLLERLVGKRRPGTKPLAQQDSTIEFIDLTGKAIG
jgi:hypothetical protein